MAWRNITSKKLRSFLTVFGIIIGIGSIAFLVSFGLGLQRLVTRNVIGDKSIKSIEVTTPNSRIIKLNDVAINKIRQFPHIDKAGLAYSFPASIGLQGGGVDSVLYGVDQNYQELTTLNLTKGRLLQVDDNRAILVSTAALKAIGLNPDKALKQQMEVAVPLQYVDVKAKELRDNFTIVGIIDSGQNNEIFVSSDLFTVAGVPTYKEMKIIADDTKNIPSLRKQIESSGFQTSSPIDTLAQINQLFKFFNIILAGFGGIGIIVAILGMFNTLTISLLERTKEIGLMITLGGRSRDMRRLFMIEAVVLSIIGAIAGVLLSFVGGRIVNFAINQNAASRVSERFDVFYMPWWLIGALIAFMMAVGLLVSYFPARRAQKINPIDALRRE
jgi:ABC-type antimicrobial peptide transport system permease subunit